MRLAALALLATCALRALAQTDAVVINATRFPEDPARLPAAGSQRNGRKQPPRAPRPVGQPTV